MRRPNRLKEAVTDVRLRHPISRYSARVGVDQFFTSNRRTEDQLPGLPDASLARTRHHILSVGSVLVLNWEAVVVCWRVKGEGKELLSSTWSV